MKYIPVYVRLSKAQIQTIRSELQIKMEDALIEQIEQFESAQINMALCSKKHSARPFVKQYDKLVKQSPMVLVLHQFGLKKGYWR